MMRKTGKLFLIFGMIICILLGTGCTKKGSPIRIKAVPEDFYTVGEPIELLLKIGHIFDFNIGDDIPSKSFALIKINHLADKEDPALVPDDLVNGETILKIDKFLTTKYRLTTYDVGNCSAFRFNNSVKIIIPQKYIVKDTGALRLTINFYYFDDKGNIEEWCKSEFVYIRYQILDNRIHIKVG